MQEVDCAAKEIHRCDLSLCLLLILLKEPTPSHFSRCTNSVVLYLLVLTQSRPSHWYGLWSDSPCLIKKLSHTGTVFPNSDLALQPDATAYVNSTTRPLSRSNFQHVSDGDQVLSHELRLLSQRQFPPAGDMIPPAAVALSRRIEGGLLIHPTSTSALGRRLNLHFMSCSATSDTWPTCFFSTDPLFTTWFWLHVRILRALRAALNNPTRVPCIPEEDDSDLL